jgi:hypothetical protein
MRRWPERFHQTWQQRKWWDEHLTVDVRTIPKPLPWPLCEGAVGPLLVPWNRIERFFRARTGGRSHRCEFTDSGIGALYGGQEGAFMDKYFEQFIGNISGEG